MRRRTFLTALLGAAAIPAAATAQITLGRQHLEPQGGPPPGGPPPGAMDPDRTAPRITPTNDLERAFLAAYLDPSQRDAFPHALLQSEVAIAMQTDAPDSPPQIVTTSTGAHGVAMYTSSSRLSSIRGPATQQLLLTGRQALTRYRDIGVVLNAGLAPYITLDPPEIARYLAMSDAG